VKLVNQRRVKETQSVNEHSLTSTSCLCLRRITTGELPRQVGDDVVSDGEQWRHCVQWAAGSRA